MWDRSLESGVSVQFVVNYTVRNNLGLLWCVYRCHGRITASTEVDFTEMIYCSEEAHKAKNSKTQ